MIMSEIEQEERQTYFQNRSREAGFNGLSLLHRLYPMYQFNILTDTVFDAMHLLPLNVVKNHFLKWLSRGAIDERELASKLKQMPWTTDYNPQDFQLNLNVWDIGRLKSIKSLHILHPSLCSMDYLMKENTKFGL